MRWWDGANWTASVIPLTVAGGGQLTPYGSPTDETKKWFPQVPSLRFPAAIVAFALVALTVVSNIVIADNPDNTGIALLGLVLLIVNSFGYPLVVFASSYLWGSRHPVHDLGLKIRAVDFAIGPAGSFVLLVTAIIVGIIVKAIKIPDGSNLDDVREAGQNAGVFIFMGVMAVIVAPITEELLFRGMLMRGLSSKVSPNTALVIQGVIFGSAHFTLSQGWGNLGLILVLTPLGLWLGWIARLTGRLWPGMLAHAGFNAAQLVLLWVSMSN